MRQTLSRLRWQLTLSHLLAIVVTLVSMVAAMVVAGSLVLDSQANQARQPQGTARAVAQVVAGLVTPTPQPAELSQALHELVSGQLRLVVPFIPDVAARGAGAFSAVLRNVDYLLVVGPNGELLASSDPAGAAFVPPAGDPWQALAAQALAGRGADKVVDRVGQAGTLTASPITDASGQPVAVLVAASTDAPAVPSQGLSFGSALAVFAAATVVLLLAASVFALLSAGLVGYLLSRGLVRRLEQLGRAAEALAHGDLSRRVAEGADDEVGQLARRFNAMAGDLERSRRELEAERDRVAGLLTARRELVAGVSHELRTPVATVRGYLEAALHRNGAVPADLRADLAVMDGEVARLQRLIDELFTLSRAEVGALTLRLQPVDVADVVRRLVAAQAPLAWQQRRVELLAEAAPDLPPARADAERLEQVVSNLLANALRHTPPGGLVAAVVRLEDEAVCLEVRDTGEGIAAEDLPHVFERFFRGQNEDGAGGAGLGLALVKDLVEGMGGSVSASSTPGQGSTFSVRLPLA